MSSGVTRLCRHRQRRHLDRLAVRQERVRREGRGRRRTIQHDDTAQRGQAELRRAARCAMIELRTERAQRLEEAPPSEGPRA